MERPSLGGLRRVGGEGELEVEAADEQAGTPGGIPVDVERWRDLARAALHHEGVRGAAELSLLFVDADAIAALNEQFMGHVGPTDVLSFPIDGDVVTSQSAAGARRPHELGPTRGEPDPGDQPLLLGDVVVCPAVAAANAPGHAGTLDDELALLVVHGILHILGHDHADPAERAVMQAKELELLEAHHWGGPAPAGFRLDHADEAPGADDDAHTGPATGPDAGEPDDHLA